MMLTERLILAAIDVIEKDGMSGFTIRRVAKECGVSCAAPYKHFRDKEGLFMAVLDYVNQKWYACQSHVAAKNEGDLKEQLIAVSMEYISFLKNNPPFRAVVLLRDDNMTPEQLRGKSEISSYTKELVSKWCIKAGYTHEQSVRKTYTVRSLIYGAILMMDNGEMDDSQENMDMIEKCIRREFDLS